MDKQKQIEELMKVMCVDFPCNRVCDQYCGMYDYAERAIKAGYRKIPENAVVLTGTETDERLLDLLVDFDEMGFFPATTCPNPEEYAKEWKRKLIYAIGQLVNEKVGKFAERVKMAFYYEFDEIIPSIMADKIDEICKEIAEGGGQ